MALVHDDDLAFLDGLGYNTVSRPHNATAHQLYRYFRARRHEKLYNWMWN